MSRNRPEPIRRSIELEYWVVDDAGRLAEPDELVRVAPGVEREFVEPLLEVKTTPCETTAALREELFDRLGRVLDRAEELDMGLVPLATPVRAEDVREIPGERTQIQNDVVGEEFAYVRHCAGTHVHVEQQPGREVDQLNTFVALDPALALVNSSPYYRGHHMAAGARSKLYRWLAYDDVSHQGRLWRYVESAAEWTRRLERRYEEFVDAALDAGADRRTVEHHFDPESAVWTPVQFRETFGTVEWRSADAALPSQVLGIADRLADVAGHLRDTEVRIEGERGEITDDAVVLPEFDSLLGYTNAAIREGLDAGSVRAYLDRMGFDVGSYGPVTHELAGRGPVSPEEARQIRLEHARRLERDFERAASATTV